MAEKKFTYGTIDNESMMLDTGVKAYNALANASTAMGYPLWPISDKGKEQIDGALASLELKNAATNFVKNSGQFGRNLRDMGGAVEGVYNAPAFLDMFSGDRPEPMGFEPRPYKPTASEQGALRGLLDRPPTENKMLNRMMPQGGKQ